MDKPMEANKRMPAIVLMVIGIAGLILGALGLMGGGRMDPSETRNGIVSIQIPYVENGENWTGLGTGWAIGKPGRPVEYIVTNAHVVKRGHKPADGKSLPIYVYFSGAENDFAATQVVYYSPPEENDIAILKLPSQTDKRVALRLRDSGTVAIGESAVALGFPSLSSQGQQLSTYDIDDITVTQGVISKRVIPAGVAFDGFQMDVPVLKGNSGGPLVDLNGNVIGINTLSFEELGMTYAIEINELIKVLDTERIEYSTSRTGLGWVPNWAGPVFLPLGVLALAAAAFLLVKSQRTAETAPETGSSPGQVIPGEARGPVAKKAVLRGVTGKFAGQVFDLRKGKVVIGRDPASSNIVFDESTQGISRRHCQIVYEPSEDRFLITDLGSSYGTYLGNGKKLPANVPEKLSAGDTFYLNNSSNRFLVTKE